MLILSHPLQIWHNRQSHYQDISGSPTKRQAFTVHIYFKNLNTPCIKIQCIKTCGIYIQCNSANGIYQISVAYLKSSKVHSWDYFIVQTCQLNKPVTSHFYFFSNCVPYLLTSNVLMVPLMYLCGFQSKTASFTQHGRCRKILGILI